MTPLQWGIISTQCHPNGAYQLGHHVAGCAPPMESWMGMTTLACAAAAALRPSTVARSKPTDVQLLYGASGNTPLHRMGGDPRGKRTRREQEGCRCQELWERKASPPARADRAPRRDVSWLALTTMGDRADRATGRRDTWRTSNMHAQRRSDATSSSGFGSGPRTQTLSGSNDVHATVIEQRIVHGCAGGEIGVYGCSPRGPGRASWSWLLTSCCGRWRWWKSS